MDNKIDGKGVGKSILEKIAKETLHLQLKPKLVVILVGDDPASKGYVRSKERACQKVGFCVQTIRLPKETSQRELENVIKRENSEITVDGILLQLPLPKHLDSRRALNKISVAKDVDGLSLKSIGKVRSNAPYAIKPCTAYGVEILLDEYNVELEGANVVVIGRSSLAGKPISDILTNRNATVTLCHSKTRDIGGYLRSADIVVSAVGIPNFITSNDLPDGVVVVDVGMNRIDNHWVGDVSDTLGKSRLITPVPGGVGPMTIACLMKNTYQCYKNRRDLDVED